MSSLVGRKRAYVRLVMLQTIFVQKIVQYLWSIWELLSKGLLPYLCIPLSQQGNISWYFDESENVMCDSKKNLKPGFHMSGKSQTIRDFTVSRLSWFPTLQILPINENWKPYISLIVWDGRGQIWRVGSVSFLPTGPRFLRWSAIIHNKWKLKFVPSRTSVMDFAHYQSPKMLGTSPLSHINMASLGQTCGDYAIYGQNLGRSAKRKIPDRLGFARHTKTRLNNSPNSPLARKFKKTQTSSLILVNK